MQTNADQRKQTNAGRRNTDRRNADRRKADFGSGNGFCIHEKNFGKAIDRVGKNVHNGETINTCSGEGF